MSTLKDFIMGLGKISVTLVMFPLVTLVLGFYAIAEIGSTADREDGQWNR